MRFLGAFVDMHMQIYRGLTSWLDNFEYLLTPPAYLARSIEANALPDDTLPLYWSEVVRELKDATGWTLNFGNKERSMSTCAGILNKILQTTLVSEYFESDSPPPLDLFTFCMIFNRMAEARDMSLRMYPRFKSESMHPQLKNKRMRT